MHNTTVAKLLAKENIEVQYGNYNTAWFDIQSRTLGLPLWKDMGKDVHDLLVGHEVGHALYTPIEVLEKARERKIPKSFINVIEDIRIEKMIQNKYPGLISNFRKGYKELLKRDFFGIGKKSKPLLELGLVDRLNIYAKTKNENIVFLDDEKWIFDDIEKSELMAVKRVNSVIKFWNCIIYFLIKMDIFYSSIIIN